MRTLRDFDRWYVGLLVFFIAVATHHAYRFASGDLDLGAALGSFFWWVAIGGVPQILFFHFVIAPPSSWRGRAGRSTVLIFSVVVALFAMDWLWERSRAGVVLLDGGGVAWFELLAGLFCAALAVFWLVLKGCDRMFRLFAVCFLGCMALL